MSALLEVDNLSKQFVTRSRLFRRQVNEAVKPVSFTLEPGQTIGFIGQNGSGKSTLARMLAGVVEPSSGEIRVNGERLEHKDYATRCVDSHDFPRPKHVIESSDSNWTNLGRSVETKHQHAARCTNEACKETLLRVGLLPEHAYFYPQMLAAGQNSVSVWLVHSSFSHQSLWRMKR